VVFSFAQTCINSLPLSSSCFALVLRSRDASR